MLDQIAPLFWLIYIQKYTHINLYALYLQNLAMISSVHTLDDFESRMCCIS